jgi:hypothetical protein
MSLPTLFSQAAELDGSHPAKEKTSAQQLLGHMEVARKAMPMVDDKQLIILTVSKFKPGGFAYTWWQNQLHLCQGRDTFPCDGDWEVFKKALLEAVKGLDESTQLRIQLRKLRMRDGDFAHYIGKFQTLVTRMDVLGEPMQLKTSSSTWSRGFHPTWSGRCKWMPRRWTQP